MNKNFFSALLAFLLIPHVMEGMKRRPVGKPVDRGRRVVTRRVAPAIPEAGPVINYLQELEGAINNLYAQLEPQGPEYGPEYPEMRSPESLAQMALEGIKANQSPIDAYLIISKNLSDILDSAPVEMRDENTANEFLVALDAKFKVLYKGFSLANMDDIYNLLVDTKRNLTTTSNKDEQEDMVRKLALNENILGLYFSDIPNQKKSTFANYIDTAFQKIVPGTKGWIWNTTIGGLYKDLNPNFKLKQDAISTVANNIIDGNIPEVLSDQYPLLGNFAYIAKKLRTFTETTNKDEFQDIHRKIANKFREYYTVSDLISSALANCITNSPKEKYHLNNLGSKAAIFLHHKEDPNQALIKLYLRRPFEVEDYLNNLLTPGTNIFNAFSKVFYAPDKTTFAYEAAQYWQGQVAPSGWVKGGGFLTSALEAAKDKAAQEKQTDNAVTVATQNYIDKLTTVIGHINNFVIPKLMALDQAIKNQFATINTTKTTPNIKNKDILEAYLKATTTIDKELQEALMAYTNLNKLIDALAQ